MNRLQQLIAVKLQEGKSLRKVAEECGVAQSNLSRYYSDSKVPDAKNLNMLALYFGVEFYELLEEVNQKTDESRFLLGLSLEKRLLWQEFSQLSDDEALDVVRSLRKSQEQK